MIHAGHTVFLRLGFRAFFPAAALFSVLATLLWSGTYLSGYTIAAMPVPAFTWHAHEMVFGYTQAVIAGFLLTAVSNWTGIQTLHGTPLLLLVLLWLSARILFIVGSQVPGELIAFLDCAFMAGLVIALLVPIAKSCQWKQLGIISKLVLLLASNLVFHAGLLGSIDDGVRIGLYSGVYIIVALILVLARRVLPFFISMALGDGIVLKNRTWLDIASLFLFLVFWIAEILVPDSMAVALLAATLAILHVIRLSGWYTAGIWHHPMLWVLFVGYAWLIAAFALKAAVFFTGISPFLALHAFAYGGIGLFTLGMMARVTLGHTGRNIAAPPPAVIPAFVLLTTGAIVRVFMPLLAPGFDSLWIGLSQALWMISFSLFALYFIPMLLQPRIDGKPG